MTTALPSVLADACDGLTALSSLMNTDPTLTLKFFPFGVLMQRKTAFGMTEHLVDPAQVALQLAANIRLDTGLLSANTLYVAQEGLRKLVAEFRPRKKTAIFLEGSDVPITVPIPDLVLLRRTTDKGATDYRAFALKGRPPDLAAKLWQVPFPNVYEDGRVCWGSVKKLKALNIKGTSLEEDWKIFLGTPFGNHTVRHKSQSHPDDIRKKYIDMEKRNTRVYPKSDLIPTRYTLKKAIEEMLR